MHCGKTKQNKSRYRTKAQGKRALALLLSTVALAVCAQTVGGPAPANLKQDIARPLEVTVNGAKAGDWVLIERAGVLYAPKEAFEQWRVSLRPDAVGIEVRGQPYFALASVPGFQSRLDFAAQSLALTFSPQSFRQTRLTEAPNGKVKVDNVLPSVFFNYDLNLAINTAPNAPSSRSLGALTELGWSTGAGVFTSTAVGRNLIANGAEGESARWTRLETAFTRNFPESNRTLRLGDSTLRSSLLGLNAYFGGVQYGTNFALTPGFISQPLPTISGLSAAPSTVELYVNNILRQVSSVPAGPFTLTNLPTFNGSGEARLVVRDLLGRETVVVQPFFSNSQLLAKGLSDWSVEAGALRRNLGVRSGSYGDGFVSGNYKQGISADLTLEGRAELTRDLQTASVGAIGVLPGQILGRAAVMASRQGGAGSGTQWLLGGEYSPPNFNANLQIQGSTLAFRQLGLEAQALPIRRQIAGSASFYTNNRSSLSAGFAGVKRFEGPRVATISLSYNTQILERGNLQVSVGRANAGNAKAAYSLGLTVVLPFEKNIVTTAGIERRSSQTSAYASAANNAQDNGEWGWRVLAGKDGSGSRAEGGLNYAAPFAVLSSDISKYANQTALRLGASGALLATDGNVYASQRLSDSFALVEVAGYPGLDIGLGGRTLAQTNANGKAILPRLVPYQSNTIRLDQNALPISAEIDNTELFAVPAARSGVKLVFATRSGRAALLRLVLADGEPAPAGATLRIDGDAEEYFVARRGEAFLTGLTPTSRVTMTWKNRQCTLDVALPPEVKDNIARVGPIVCKGVER